MLARLHVFVGLVLFALLSSSAALGWGKYGHLTICDLAYRNLTDPAKLALQQLMHTREGGITVEGRGQLDDRNYTSFNVGCLEEDELPRRHLDNHFINVSRDTTAIESASCPAGQDCILKGIERDIEVLGDAGKSDEERVFALMALGHWIGDIHQPLHVSFVDDRGGNRIKVSMPRARCGTAGGSKPKNLHAVWDNCLLEALLFERVRQRSNFRSTWGKRTITYRAVDILQVTTTLSEERDLVAGDPWDWAAESYAITLQPEVAYCVPAGDTCQYSAEHAEYDQAHERTQVIDAAYLTNFAPVAQERVRRAGFRLAHLINQALDQDYDGPIMNSTQGL